MCLQEIACVPYFLYEWPRPVSLAASGNSPSESMQRSIQEGEDSVFFPLLKTPLIETANQGAAAPYWMYPRRTARFAAPSQRNRVRRTTLDFEASESGGKQAEA